MAIDPRTLAERIAKLDAQQRQTLLAKLVAQGIDPGGLPIVPFPDVAAYPLSYAQQGLWLTWQMAPESSAYNMAGVVALHGALQPDALHKAVQALAERHAVLRSVFEVDANDAPMQRVLPQAVAAWRHERVEQVTGDAREAAARALCQDDATRPFDLARAPAWRVTLISLSANEHWLSLTMHHMLADGWSQAILLRDLAALYEAQAHGQPPALPSLPIQFGDYALWQREWYAASQLPTQLQYWRERLGQDPEPLRLPLDRPRPARRDAAAGACTLTLPADLAASARALAQRCGASVFMTLLAAFKLTLARYCGQEDIVVGAPLANRVRRETHGLIGYLTNMSVLRTQVDAGQGMAALVGAVRATLLDAQANQDCPYDLLVSELVSTRTPGLNPLFQVKCTEQADSADAMPARFADLAMQGVDDAARREAHFDLSLDVTIRRDEIRCQFDYAQDIFDADTIARMAQAYAALLRQGAAQPDLPVALLDIPEDASRLDGEAAQWEDRDLLALWTRAAARQPGGIALQEDAQALSHAELEQAVQRLAGQLQARGVAADVRVAVHAPRGSGFVMAMLAVLRAGGAYVPLDPALPQERLKHVAQDCGAALILSDADTAWAPEIPRLPISASLPPDPSAPASTWAPVHPDQAAYVIYTSGSTGVPKGVVVSRGALSNYVQGMLHRFALPGSARAMAMVSTVSADLGHTTLYGALCTGCTLHLVTQDCVFDPDRFAAYMAQHQVDVLKIVPSHLQALLQAARPADVLPRHTLVLGGEASSRALLDRVAALAPQCRVVNHYGPTETTVGALTQAAVQAQFGPLQALPIGAPLPNMQAYVLDAWLNPVPRGAEGELYLAGAGVARGYLGRPGLTADRYVASPYVPGQRMYRTGDRVRQRGDGSLVFLGRMDDQVKIRGYRVEPGEVAVVLRGLPGVADCAVVARGEDDADATRLQLHAYVVARQGAVIDGAALRDALAACLPDYMVPATFTLLDALPLNANGKLDRRALPAPRTLEAARDTAADAPGGPVETALAAIWAEVLGVAEVGRSDNFFELGGDSILSLKVMARARRQKLAIKPRQLFDHQTLQALAAAISPPTAATAAADPPEEAAPVDEPVARSGADAVGVLSHAQQRQWFLWRMDPDSTAYHVNGALHLRGTLDRDALNAAFNDLVRRHASLRTRFVATADGQAQAVVADPGPVTWLTHDARTPLDALACVQAWVGTPFDLETGPLLRLGLIRQADDDHVLVVVMHHIVSDGWSMQIIVEEFTELYRAYVERRPAALAALSIAYTDYAAWQRRWLAEGEGARQRAHWVQRLGGAQPVLQLPADGVRRPGAQYRAARHTFYLTAQAARELRATAQARQATLFAALLAGFQAVLHRYSGETDIRVGTPIANRHRGNTDRVVGFFVNTQVLRADCSPGVTLDGLLLQARDAAREAQAHQDLPFEQLVDALQPERDGHSPLFQVLFNHQRPDYRGLQALPGLRVTDYAFGEQAAQFELSCNTAELADGRVQVTLLYAQELFDARTMSQLAGHYAAALQALVSDPSLRVDRVALLSPRERASLRAWSGAPLARPAADEAFGAATIHGLIEAAARARPDAPALTIDGQTLTYAEFNARANRLAHRLIATGVRPEAKVGIALARSADMVIAMVAVLKAGGAYVPLDPDYPEDRLRFMAQDSGVSVVLTESTQHDRLPWLASALPDVAVLNLDALALEASPAHDPAARTHPQHLAYVIYTSGSTGRPKGAQLCHRQVCRLLSQTADWFAFGAADVWTLFHSYAFDFSVWEVFGALCTGGRLVVVPHAVSRDPEAFLALLRREQVTVLNQTPSAFLQLMQTPGLYESAAAASGLALRQVIFGGEALEPRKLQRWFDHFGDQSPALVNMYGITETTVHVTYRRLTLADVAAGGSPIGARIPDLGLHVLDSELNVAPIGVPGELHVSGAGLARGYLNRAGLTAERFIADPQGSGQRLYRTGDLVRWTQDGQLEYLGRIDQQVKIRGFRIELGEIEASLLAHPAVEQAAVLAQEGPSGARLVAYVAPADVDTTALRTALSAALPDYMVPAAFVTLDALPVNANGKLDRKALPKAEFAASQGYAAPEGEVETALAAIWSQVLGAAQVGRHDNFFELGGDSILSLQIVARLRQAGWQVTPRQVFERQTVADLASVAVAAQAQDATDEAVGDLPLLPIQAAFLALPLASHNHWNQAVLLHGDAPVDAQALSAALQAVATQHAALRLRFKREDGAWRQRYEAAPDRADMLWLRSDVPVADIEAQCDAAQRSLDIEHGPLLRAVLMQVADGTSRVLLVIHHLAVDGVSWRVLLADLQLAYTQALAGGAITLPARSASFGAWARRLLDSRAAYEPERDYWRALPAGDALPCDNAQGANRVGDQQRVALALDRATTQALLKDAPGAYRTQVNDLLLAALAQALGEWGGLKQVRIDLEGHGREDATGELDLSRTVGWFTSVYPVVLDTQGEPGERLMRVKEALRAVPSHGLGYGVLADALRDLPQAPVLFNYLGQFETVTAGDAGWRIAAEAPGAGQDEAAPLGHDLTFNGQVHDGQLRMSLGYSGKRHEPARMQALARHFEAALRALVAHCVSGAHGVTPSDFPLAGLTWESLRTLDIPAPPTQWQDIYPVTPMQAGMLFHSVWDAAADEGQPPAYVNQLRVDIDGLDVERFRAAWTAALARHDVLRTGFVQRAGAPLQWVAREVALPYAVIDARAVQPGSEPTSTLRARLDAIAQGDLARGFDLSRPPLLRLTLARISETAYHLVWTHHHLLLDGWSVSQLLGEVLSAYAAQPVSRGGGRYRDFLAWLGTRDAVAIERYWKAALRELDAPTLLSPASGGAARGAGHEDVLAGWDAAASEDLAAYARRERVTVNTVVQAAWALVLAQATGQGTVAFGATTSGRPDSLPGAQQTLGLYINTLPVIVPTRVDATAGDWLRTLQAQNVASREVEQTPLADVQRWAGANGQALFDTLLVFENYPVDAVLQAGAPAGLRFEGLTHRDQASYALSLVVAMRDKLELRFTYDRAQFGRSAIDRLAARMDLALRQLMHAPAEPIAGVRILPEADLRLQNQWERGQPLADAVAAEFGALPVHRQFERQARQWPDRVAVTCFDASLTYGELDRRANQLAHRLQRLGVRSEDRVGIAAERSLDLVVALLAVLKAGAAYVPLDPDYPDDRLAYMLQDSGVPLLLTQTALAPRMGALSPSTTLLALDQLEVSSEPKTAPDTPHHAENLAYVIYTSGSTGKPKGAANRHVALTNRLAWMQQAYGLTADDVVLQKTPFSFDVSVWEFFWPLMTGARLALAAPGEHRDPARLSALIQEQGVTTLHFVPSMLHAFISHAEQAGAQSCATLRRIVCSGEALGADLQARCLALLPQAGMYNLYGPTEAAIDVTHWTCVDDGSGVVPIGYPIAGIRTRVLDSQLNPVPLGVPGELYLGGVGLARGYLNRPGLTADRFVADPDGQGYRLYRTGDLVRWTQGGQLEYLGRLDHQVKIRGLRIELGEIEASLLAHPAVEQAAVLAQEGPSGARLVAYVAPAAVDTTALRTALSAALPDYMVPAAFVTLDALPVNANGKLDRKVLPKAEFAASQGYAAPEGEVETALAVIWSQVLGAAQVGRHDNFFELGGDSILSLQIVARLRQAGWQVTPRQVFERQTVADLASVAAPLQGVLPRQAAVGRAAQSLADYPDAPPLAELGWEADDVQDVYPLSPTQEGMLFHTLEAQGTGLYVNQLSVRLDGVDGDRLADAWRAMVARHPVLRTAFLWRAGMKRPLQAVLTAARPDIVREDWRDPVVAGDAAAYAAAELARQMDFAQARLARVVLIRLGPDSYQLIWTYHHLLLDGWSASRLIGEWLRAYGGEPLPAAGPGYGDYARWLGAQDRADSERFWKGALAALDGPTLLAQAAESIVANHPHAPAADSAAQTPYGKIYTRLDESATQALRALAQAQRVTLNTVIQAAWAIVLQRYTQQDTVVFGATVAGRPATLAGVEDILGLFINTLPVPVSRNPAQSVSAYLQALQQTNVRLREQEHAALSDIQRWAGSSGRPLFDSILVFENYPIDETLKRNERYGLRFGPVAGSGLTGYVMDLQVVANQELEIEYCYARATLGDAMAAGLRAQLEHVLAQMQAAPSRPVGELTWLDGAQQAALARWSVDPDQPVVAAGRHGYVHEQIRAHALARGQACALALGDTRMSYAQLDLHANRLAQRLVRFGVRPESRVGVAMPRSLDTVVAFLAVLKAGGAYVPLDLEHPADRLAYVIDDSGMSLVITGAEPPGHLPRREGVQVLAYDAAAVADEPPHDPAVALSPDNMAYVIYTSGSTGKPKGVAVTHGPLAMHCRATARIYGLTPDSHELLFMSFSFDGAHERWLTALTTGAELAVRGPDLWTAEQALDALRRHQTSHVAFPPAYLNQMAEWAAAQGDAPPVDLYVFGGEAMPRAAYERVRQHLRPNWLINGYGPTETVVTPLIWKTPADASFDCAYAPIGKPVGAREVYVLDGDLQQVPVGHLGELYIGGYGVARGYLGRPDLTADRYVANPFGEPGARMYRSGDIVRWMGDGNIEYAGRGDHQVKIRGFRIELGEIEARILALDSVAEAAVVVHEDAGGKKLAAYVVPAAGEGAGLAAELRGQLAAHLPDYMVPASFTVLAALPRLISGKLDRAALPAPQAGMQRDFVAPSTEPARVLAGIWQDVLGVDRVGQTDNFFELGGDSLLSLKVLARVRALRNPELSFTLRDLMQRPTIGQLLRLQTAGPATVSLPTPLNGGQGAGAPLFCIHAGMGTLFDYQPLARRLNGVRPVYGLPCRMLDDPAHRDVSLERMADDYCAQIQALQDQGPYHLAGWSLGGTLAALIAARLEAQGQQVAYVGLIDPYVPGIDTGPLRDWRDDLRRFAAVVAPGARAVHEGAATPAAGHADEPISLAAAQARLEQWLSTADTTQGYAGMGAAELARIFLVARALQALSLQTVAVDAVRAPARCWWTPAREAVQRQALAAQLRQAALDSQDIDTDHYGIVRDARMLDQMLAQLSALDMEVAA
ncbi:non-ribosomal peptide synthetase [Achromobacter sp. MFA1 R4]|uniref:non-ribosomal peptide synthetase n=1 Tax=Achromobacter sp. MFA1 R4 TaxID=1881016 RepID=UPI00095385A4|nr:non-ribosomal peptide synthetase [Achromobacter sp. MFA1 R4]SIT01149.1 non-ribosomal peptide synthase domain TIGR01720/amino acid adenylation domain-containing protein [Achromobacter sp. MFA1 R4]